MNPSSDNPYDELEPLFNGLPAIVRLITNEDILCILFQRRESLNDKPSEDKDIDFRMFLERPLRAITVDARPSAKNEALRSGEKIPRTVYATVQTRFERWMTFTSAIVFPMYPEHILSIAPLAEPYINGYMAWAEELYQQPAYSTADTSTNFSDQTEEEVRRAYMEYILHQFNPKGKPN